jgi:hypothetical protein
MKSSSRVEYSDGSRLVISASNYSLQFGVALTMYNAKTYKQLRATPEISDESEQKSTRTYSYKSDPTQLGGTQNTKQKVVCDVGCRGLTCKL